MTLWLASSEVRVVELPAGTHAQKPDQRSRRALAHLRPSRAWMFLLLSTMIFVSVLWWRWNSAWEELESGLRQSNIAAHPQSHVPAEVMAKLVTHRVDPEYPAAAQSAKLQAVIALDVVVGRDGSVLDVRALNGPDVLAKAAVEALRWWRFKPYLINGRPAVVETRIAVEFKP
jgi:TonB family protein